ncbi:MAG: ATP-binding protein [Planctomycetota bacterium]|jgi:PAS domain S-box-containing protein
MRPYSRWSLKPKLIAVIMAATLVTLTIATVVFYRQVTEVYRTHSLKSTQDLADILAISTQSAIIFDDPHSAAQSLGAIQATPEVLYACVFAPNGQVFAEYRRASQGPSLTPPFTSQTLHRFQRCNIDYYRCIEQEGDLLGVLYLHYDLTRIQSEQQRTLSVAGGLIVLALILAFLLATRLQRIISIPIGALCATMNRVRDEQDYTLRGEVLRNDEVGALAGGFNEMLEAVEHRDHTLKENLNRTETIIQTIPGALFISNDQGVILEVLTPLRYDVVQSKDDLIGKGFADFVVPEDLARMKETLTSLVETGAPQQAVFRIEENESLRWFEIRAALMPDHPNRDRRIVSIISDITQRKQAEEDLLSTQEQLHQAQKMESIGHLAGGVAHDFNNQLAIIMGYSDILSSCPLNQEAITKYGESIRTAARRSADLTRQLLAFARKGNFQAVPLDIHKIIGEVVDMLHHSVDKKITIKQHLNAYPSTITGDPSQLQNAILNLGINARDAMPKGGELLFRTTSHEVSGSAEEQSTGLKPGPHVLIQVSDSGTGIPEDVLESIFEPFFTTKDIGKGTGMGLAAVYGTLQSHQGAVTVDTEIGKGTTFNLYLPLLQEGSDETTADVEAVLPKGKGCILIIDDEEPVAEMAGTMLKALGYGVTIATSGREGISIYERAHDQVDLILLDMVMPDLNGQETCQQLRTINPEVRILISSGHNLTNTDWSFTEADSLGFIQKPYLIGDLARQLDEQLKKK